MLVKWMAARREGERGPPAWADLSYSCSGKAGSVLRLCLVVLADQSQLPFQWDEVASLLFQDALV